MPIDFLKMPLPSKKKVEIEMEPMEEGAEEMGMDEAEMADEEMPMVNEMLKDVSDEDLMAEAKARGLM